jgi:hypothetical protein
LGQLLEGPELMMKKIGRLRAMVGILAASAIAGTAVVAVTSGEAQTGVEPPARPSFLVVSAGTPVDLSASVPGASFRTGSMRLALKDATGTYATARDDLNDLCFIYVAATGPHPWFSACQNDEDLKAAKIMLLNVSGEGISDRTVGLVPDGVTGVRDDSGRRADVRRNVFAFDNGGKWPTQLTMTETRGAWSLDTTLARPTR